MSKYYTQDGRDFGMKKNNDYHSGLKLSLKKTSGDRPKVSEFILEVVRLRKKNLTWGDQQCEEIGSKDTCSTVETVTKQCKLLSKDKDNTKCVTNYGPTIEYFFGLVDELDRKKFLSQLHDAIMEHTSDDIMWLDYFVKSDGRRIVLDSLIESHIKPLDALGLRTYSDMDKVMDKSKPGWLRSSPLSYENTRKTAIRHMNEQQSNILDAQQRTIRKIEMLQSEAQVVTARNLDHVKHFVASAFSAHLDSLATTTKVDREGDWEFLGSKKKKMTNVNWEYVTSTWKHVDEMYKIARDTIDAFVASSIALLTEKNHLETITDVSNFLSIGDYNRVIKLPIKEEFLLDHLTREVRNNGPEALLKFYRSFYPRNCYQLEAFIKDKILEDYDLFEAEAEAEVVPEMEQLTLTYVDYPDYPTVIPPQQKVSVPSINDETIKQKANSRSNVWDTPPHLLPTASEIDPAPRSLLSNIESFKTKGSLLPIPAKQQPTRSIFENIEAFKKEHVLKPVPQEQERKKKDVESSVVSHPLKTQIDSILARRQAIVGNGNDNRNVHANEWN